MTNRLQKPVNVPALEQAALQSWPARETLACGGWLMRFSDGQTHRGNSVATLALSGALCDALGPAIDRVEREYRARSLRPMFQIADANAPMRLEAELIARGYVCVTPTLTCAASVAVMRRSLPPMGAVRMSQTACADFARLVRAGSRSVADGTERLDILARLALPHVCVVAYEDEVAVACASGTLTDGFVGINLMRTDAHHRRRGHARRVLSSLAQWAEQRDAKTAYLAVEHGNSPAVALYEHAGFQTVSSYRYYRLG